MAFTAKNDREALHTMLDKTSKSFSIGSREIRLTVESGKDFVFTFDSRSSLRKTTSTTPKKRGVHGFNKEVNFSNFNFGPLTLDYLKSMLPGVSYVSHIGLDGKASIIGVPGSNHLSGLRVNFNQGDFGAESGMKFLIPIPKSREYQYEYNVCFGKDFDFVVSGYLPGLGAGLLRHSQVNLSSINWSSQFRWGIGGRATYKFDTAQTMDLQDENGSPILFEAGKWYRVQCRVKLNTTNTNNDGELQIWLDGKLVFENLNFQVTSTADLEIEWFHLGANFGDTNSNHAASKDDHLIIRNVRIYT